MQCSQLGYNDLKKAQINRSVKIKDINSNPIFPNFLLKIKCKLISNKQLKKKKTSTLTLCSTGSDQLLRPAPVSAEWHCGDGERKITQTNANNSGSAGHNWRPC